MSNDSNNNLKRSNDEMNNIDRDSINKKAKSATGGGGSLGEKVLLNETNWAIQSYLSYWCVAIDLDLLPVSSDSKSLSKITPKCKVTRKLYTDIFKSLKI